jgi:hypothetical protein
MFNIYWAKSLKEEKAKSPQKALSLLAFEPASPKHINGVSLQTA